VTSETGARRPRSISNFGGLCQTRKTPTLTPREFQKNEHFCVAINQNGKYLYYNHVFIRQVCMFCEAHIWPFDGAVCTPVQRYGTFSVSSIISQIQMLPAKSRRSMAMAVHVWNARYLSTDKP
jgi:hypothetical protein